MTKVALHLAILCVPLIAISAVAQPAPSSSYTSIEAIGEKPVQLGYYASANKNCSPAPLPTIRVLTVPKSGIFTVRRGELKTSKFAGCPELKVNAQVAFYQARAGSTANDRVVYEVTSPNGEVAVYDVTITIKPASEPGKPSGPDSKI